MNTKKFDNRLPQLRIDEDLMQAIKERAEAQGITLAAAHRQILRMGLGKTALVIPKAGTVNKRTGIITPNEYWPVDKKGAA